MHIQYGSHSDQGRVRTSNEDSFAANLKNRIFLVADGMGGHAAGEIASMIAAATVEEVVASLINSGRSLDDILLTAVQEANNRIYQAQRDRPELSGMGSTLTALALHQENYYVAHVGDSRAYMLRDGELEQLTRDHSLVWQLYESGVLAKGELSSHPQKNLITRSIGPHPQVEIDIEHGTVCEGDVFLLCSDGLTDMVPDDGIRSMLSDKEAPPQRIGEALVQTANLHGGQDNITAVVVRLDPGEAEADAEITGKLILPAR